MMNPKALEALRQARALFAEKADDIPQDAQPVPPLRKPQVHLIPTNAPKFTKESMKQENKAEGIARVMHENGVTPPKQIDEYVGLSTRKACEKALAKGIKKPSDIAKETGKNVNQIYTALWIIKKAKRKAKLAAKAAVLPQTPKQQADEWNREPTPFEDAHYVVLKSREDYEKEIDSICMERNKLEKENAELRAVIKYLERKVMV